MPESAKMKKGTAYKIHLPPVVRDVRLYEYAFRIESLRALEREVEKRIVAANRDVGITVGLVVGVLSRMMECLLSVFTLVAHGQNRDAGVLVLNLFELRLDLEYISHSKKREEVWLSHANQKRKPWLVTGNLGIIASLRPEAGECLAEDEMFKHLSMIKHGNPAGGEVSFRVGVEEGQLFIASTNSSIGRVYLHAAGLYLYSALKASLVILGRHGIMLEGMHDKLDAARAELNRYWETDVTREYMRLMYSQSPALRPLMRKRKALVKQRDAALRRLSRLKKERAELDRGPAL
jgi:hypothetical protein